jgi:hypothetical protein
MKKISIIAALAAATLMLVSSCGAQKAATGGMGQKKAKSEAQLYAEDPNATTIRAWALYNGFAEDNLEQRAAVLARQELSNTIATLVTGAIENYSDTYSKQQMGGTEGIDKRRTLSESSKDKVSSVTQELIRGSRIAVSDRYVQSDGTETAYVCVELDIPGLIDNLKNNTDLQDVISKEEKLDIDFSSEVFSDSVSEEFSKLNDLKAKGL